MNKSQPRVHPPSLPLSVVPCAGGVAAGLVDGAGRRVGDIWHPDHAEFLVRAANHHSLMLKACKIALHHLSKRACVDPIEQSVIDVIASTIAAAEGTAAHVGR